MTDHMDDLLHDAGRRWRSAQPSPPEPDRSRWSRPARSPRSSRWIPVVATAGATVIVVGIGYAVVVQSWWDRQEVTDHVSVATAPSTSGAANMVVRDGDRVQASGMVLAAPGQPARFCAPAMTAGVARPGDVGIPDCQFGVEVTGVDLDTLSGADERAGVRFGTASLWGSWRSGVLSVTEQGVPAPEGTPPIPDMPCTPPPAGWKTTGPVDGKKLHQYVEEEHPDRFRRPWVSYPDGLLQGATPQPGTIEVLVVEVVSGDADDARRELRRRYSGNLCVVHNPGGKSLADQVATHDAAQAALSQLMQNPANGIFGVGGADTVTVDLVMISPELYERLAGAGLDSLELRPWLQPIR